VIGLMGLAGTASAQPDDYALQPGDLLSVTVYEEAELSREVLVRPDGGISFPLIGDMAVAGLSPDDVRGALETRLAEFIPGASVTVAVMQINGNQVFVVGKVNRPGAFPIYRPLDVMQALALAGGTAQFAELDDIRILRRDANGRQRVLEFKYSDVVRGRNLEQNLLLMSGDTIVVP
jgi:polysaccharide export outer membrane protein